MASNADEVSLVVCRLSVADDDDAVVEDADDPVDDVVVELVLNRDCNVGNVSVVDADDVSDADARSLTFSRE